MAEKGVWNTKDTYKKIDWELVAKLFEADCTILETCAMVGLCRDAVNKSCKKDNGCTLMEFKEKHRFRGNTNLRSKQYSSAIEGDRGMLIWLGKNRLDQSDHRAYDIKGETKVSVVNFGTKEAKPWQEPKKQEETL